MHTDTHITQLAISDAYTAAVLKVEAAHKALTEAMQQLDKARVAFQSKNPKIYADIAVFPAGIVSMPRQTVQALVATESYNTAVELLSDISTVFPNISETQVKILKSKLIEAFNAGGKLGIQLLVAELKTPTSTGVSQ